MYMNNSLSVKVWYSFDFDCCYGNNMAHKTVLKIEKLPSWNKFETIDRGINKAIFQQMIRITKAPKNYGSAVAQW